MSKTSSVFARVEPDIKEQAEQVLNELGIPMSNAIGLFLKQVVLQRGIPFEMKLPAKKAGRIRRAVRRSVKRGVEPRHCGF